MAAKPTEGERRFWVVIGGMIIPFACFAVGAAVDAKFAFAPDWQRGRFGDYAGLLFVPVVYVGMALLIAFAAAATAWTVNDAARAAQTRWVRPALICGVAVSLPYLVAASMVVDGGPMILSAGVGLAFWVIDLVARRFVSRQGVYFIHVGILGVVVTSSALSGDGAGLVLLVLALAALCAGPLWSLIAYLTALRMLPEKTRAPLETSLVSAGYIASWAWALVQAQQYYAALPTEKPSGCFVVGAAARGHPRLVRSWTLGGRPVTRQLILLKSFEFQLERDAPRTHRLLRRVYNRIGPAVANRIRSPWSADVVYLALKPIEWLTRIYGVRHYFSM